MKWFRCAFLAMCVAIFHSVAWATEAELGYGYDTLDSGRVDWSAVYIEVNHKIAERQAVYGSLRETRRFARIDQEFLLGMYYPLNARWTALAEASVSPSHQILAKWAALGQAQCARG